MKKLIGLIFNGWTLAIVGLLAFSLLLWIVGPLISIGKLRPLDSALARALTVAAICLFILLIKVWAAIKARKTNTAVVGQLVAETPGVPGDEETEVIKERFAKALALLKSARFGPDRSLWASASARVGQRYLYELPWYVIVGAPGSGKTTALRNSGLEFPLAATMGEAALQGVGGTRHCDWWFTSQAVLIDTAGRYATQDSDQARDQGAWRSFLRLLKRSRPRQPINGVLLTVSVADLLTRGAPERANYAAAMRARLQELHEQLGVRFPVYLWVTKIDLLAGFVDYLGDAGREVRQEPWGYTFPIDAQMKVDLARLPAEFDLLQARLVDGLVARLQAERDPVRRARIYGFPQQFAGLREVLGDFVQKVFAPSQFAQPVLLRGVYFVSGTQEGTPIDRLLGAISRNYKLARPAVPAHQAGGKSYFLARLLQEVIFGEANLAGTNLGWERRRSSLALAGYALIALVVAAALAAWTVSYLNNRAYVRDVAARVETVRQALQASSPEHPTSDIRALLPTLAATQALSAGDRNAVPLSMGFGLYQGSKLDAATQQVYKRILEQSFQPALGMRLEEQLRGSFNNPELQYEALKTYLMFYDEKHYDPTAIRRYLATDWDVNLPREVSSEDRKALLAHLDALLAAHPVEPLRPQDKSLVAQVRNKLASVSLAQRVYNRIRNEGVGADIPAFTITKTVGEAGAQVFVRGSPEASVAGLYTYDGYHKGFDSVVQQTTQELHAEEGWVLGVADPPPGVLDGTGVSKLPDDVRRLYLQDYAKIWEAFIADIRLVKPAGLDQAIQAARVLSAPDNPLAPLMRAMVHETTLTVVEQKSAVDQAQDVARNTLDRSRDQLARILGGARAPGSDAPRAAVERIVDDRFENLRQYVKPGPAGAPAPLDASIALINEVYVQLSAADTAVRARNPPPPSDTPNKVKAEAARLPEPVRSLLATLSASGNTAVLSAARGNLSGEMSASIGDFCRKAIEGRYPFTRASSTDVTQDDFARLFAPDGLLDGFFKKNLAGLVDTSTHPWSFRKLGDGSMGASPGTLAQFERAATIRDTFFRSGGRVPALRLEFKAVEMDTSILNFSLDFDGQVVKYAHDPIVPTTVVWPGPKGGTQVQVQFQPPLAGGKSSMSTDGPWSLFRLFDKLALTQTAAPERFRATFDIDNRKAVFEITASSVVNPFKLPDLAQFSCPNSI